MTKNTLLLLSVALIATSAMATDDYQTSFTAHNYSSFNWRISTTDDASGVIARSDNNSDYCGAPLIFVTYGLCKWDSSELNQQYIYVIFDASSGLSPLYEKVTNSSSDSTNNYLVCENKVTNQFVTGVQCKFNSTGDYY